MTSLENYYHKQQLLPALKGLVIRAYSFTPRELFGKKVKSSRATECGVRIPISSHCRSIIKN